MDDLIAGTRPDKARKHGRPLMRGHGRPLMRGARNGLIGAVAIAGGLLMTSAPAGAFTSSPLWQCRGSALYASIAGMNRVEPEVANGSPNTGNGGNPDRAQCVNSEVGANNLATPVGLPANFLSAPTAYANTTITPEIGASISQTIVAQGGVENLALQLPAGAGVVALGVGAANAKVTGSCVNGVPKLTGTSQAVNITLGGNVVTLDGLLTGLSQLLQPLNGLVSVKVNEQIATSTSLITRALHISVINPANQAPLLDVIIGEAKGGFDPNVCNKDMQFTLPPGIGGTDANGNPISSGGSSNSGANGTDHNGNVGSTNGAPATCGVLTMYFDRNKKHTLSSIYGVRNVTRGRIVTCGSHPKSIVGAKIDVIHIINGKRHLIKTGLKSRPGGKLTLILPSNLTTRSIEYDYRGVLSSSKVTSKVTLHLTVHKRNGQLI
jgi:hypothetical protein